MQSSSAHPPTCSSMMQHVNQLVTSKRRLGWFLNFSQNVMISTKGFVRHLLGLSVAHSVVVPPVTQQAFSSLSWCLVLRQWVTKFAFVLRKMFKGLSEDFVHYWCGERALQTLQIGIQEKKSYGNAAYTQILVSTTTCREDIIRLSLLLYYYSICY